MNLKQKIEAFKQKGDRTIIDDILQALETNFTRNHTRKRVKDGTPSGGIRIKLEDHHEYIAYRIKAMEELILRHYRVEFRASPALVDEFQRLLSIIYIDIGIKFDASIYRQDRLRYYFQFSPELFVQLEKHKRKIKQRMRSEDYASFKYLFGYFRDKVDATQPELKKRQQEIRETAIKVIEYALQYVDTSKSEREIVKYMNKAIISKLSDREIKRNGLRRIRRKNITYLVDPYFPKSNYRVIYGVDDIDLFTLLQQEKDFIEEICKLIDHDRQLNDFTGYSTNELGEARIRRKYIANKLGLNDAVVRQRLKRIKEKACPVTN